jgi:hypothetical protein
MDFIMNARWKKSGQSFEIILGSVEKFTNAMGQDAEKPKDSLSWSIPAV